MKRIPFNQFIVGLDKLMFGVASADVQKQADTIEAYLEATGYTWDLVLEEMFSESPNQLQRQFSN